MFQRTLCERPIGGPQADPASRQQAARKCSGACGGRPGSRSPWVQDDRRRRPGPLARVHTHCRPRGSPQRARHAGGKVAQARRGRGVDARERCVRVARALRARERADPTRARRPWRGVMGARPGAARATGCLWWSRRPPTRGPHRPRPRAAARGGLPSPRRRGPSQHRGPRTAAPGYSHRERQPCRR